MSTQAMLWSGHPCRSIERGERQFRIGTVDGARYHFKDLLDNGPVMVILQASVPEVRWIGCGTNYLMVAAPKDSLEKLHEATPEINQTIEQFKDEPTKAISIK